MRPATSDKWDFRPATAGMHAASPYDLSDDNNTRLEPRAVLLDDEKTGDVSHMFSQNPSYVIPPQ